MNRSEKIFANHFLTDHDSILEVVTFPGHERHFQVTSQGHFTSLYSISFCKEVTFLDSLSLLYSRFQVDTGFLVCFNELGELVYFQIVFKADELLYFISLITHMDLIGIHEFHQSFSFGMDLDA